MEIRSILSTLRRHKTAAALIVVEIALTGAIVCNAVHLIAQRVERMGAPSGMAEAELLRIETTSMIRRADAHAQTRRDVALLRQVPGVKQVTVSNQVPYGNSAWTTGVNLRPDQAHETTRAAIYGASDGFIATTGLRLVAGRDFAPEEYQDWQNEGVKRDVPVVILSRVAAEHLFPGKNALGGVIYVWDTPSRVIGIVDRVALPARRPDLPEGSAIIMPVRMTFDGGTFVLRVDPSQRDAVLRAAVTALETEEPRHIVLKQETFEATRARFFKQDRAMAWLLVAVCIALLVVTSLGIVGLASFWVQQRTRMIGVRRALGARRLQILRYFQTENLLLTGAGIVLGMAGAWAINLLLMMRYEVPALPLGYLPAGALVLVGLGQVAVLGPALRAAALPPVVVMRLG